jgi:diacylglycerol kinase (ATP)
MQKVALLYNPDSGGSRKRQKQLDAALRVLRDAGIESELVLAESRATAGDLARSSIESGCDTIFACGGDGTIHNIVQVLASTDVTLGILPLGTANALAHDLGVPKNIEAAARAALTAKPMRVALGRVEYVNLQGGARSRYFVIAAGVGVDAHLFYKLHTGAKQRMGMAAYYAKAWNLWFTYVMPRFVAEYEDDESSEKRTTEVTELMGIRIRDFGGMVRELAPGAALERDDMRVVFAKTASRAAYLAYVIRGVLGKKWHVPGVELAYSKRVFCNYKEENNGARVAAGRQKIYVEADGELLGTLPATITVVPKALSVLAPRA